MCWERPTRGWRVHLCPLLAGGTPLEHCTTVLPEPEPVTDPAAAERWESLRSQACLRRAGALAPTKAPLRAALTRCAPQLSWPSLAPGHPARLPVLPPERAFISTERRRSDPLSGRLSALAAVAGRERGWAEAAGGSREIAGAGVAEAAGKWQTKLLFVKSGVA